ncbi:phage tail sheath C-terminal domain-containing protein [Paraburkholderia xenovorans]|uniref:phage tail sheath family protein n=1 Tax=Paraburkholderia xenovorans TaxID=36873 RepID=UPI0038B6F415
MSAVPTYPGVYISEQDGAVISVNSAATCVPIFAVGGADSNTKDLFDTATRIYSWLDWLNKKGDKTKLDYLEDKVLRSYFENGGGPCYVVAVASMATQVPDFADITLLVASGLDISKAVRTLCVDGSGLFAILDGPQTQITSTYDPSTSYTANPDAAVYYPWILTSWSTDPVPPSGAIAGVYCSTDRTRGVWKAPANVALKGGVQPEFLVSDDLQSHFNTGLAINMIRNLDSRGAVVWGARTLQGSDAYWQYISVRRLFNSAQKDIQAAMNSWVTQPNYQPTWAKVGAAISNYLYGLWQRGALVGKTEAEAYFVDIGTDTMTQADIDAGKLIAKVGMAAVRPAEFIFLKFTSAVNQT